MNGPTPSSYIPSVLAKPTFEKGLRVKLLSLEGSMVQGGQAFPDGVFGELDDVMNFQLVHDLLAVGFHGLQAHIQGLGDLAIGLALGHELKHLPFPGTKY